ncbi:MAG: hypothetical protein H0V36_03245 [Chloroflexi bacterium]|nr:hypothetical protein [Chloroflexota bacterium]
MSLWLAEDADDVIQAATAAAVFDRLRAAPFVRRARRRDSLSQPDG